MSECLLVPAKGQRTFSKLKEVVGYKQAVEIFDRITANEFNNIYGTQVTYDSDGVPTFESVMQLKVVKDFIGNQKILDSLNKNQPHLEDNLENVSVLIGKAQEFNNSNEDKDFVAIVDYDDNKKITVRVVNRTEETENNALYQYKILQLNKAAAEILNQAGITIDKLSDIETAVGRVGVTEFNYLSDMLGQFTAVIRVANNLEGFNAVSEELAHFIIGVNNDKPLVKRSIEYFKEEKHAREVLGDSYDKVYEYYNGDMNLVAEEAAGHIFRDILVEKMENPNAPLKQQKLPLFSRMFNFILSLFKGINPAHYQDTLDRIKYDYGKFADDILEGKRIIRQADIKRAKREASFNALSERVDAQLNALKKMQTNSYKAAALQKELDNRKGTKDTRKKLLNTASRLDTIINQAENTGESVKAITKALSLFKSDMDAIIKQLSQIDTFGVQDRFRVLSNALDMLTICTQRLDELDVLTANEFMTDPDITSQTFMADDVSDSLSAYRTTTPTEKVDTEGKSPEQIIRLIKQDGDKWQLADDEKDYVNELEHKRGLRVTSTIQATEGAEEGWNPDSPWLIPSTNIGTGFDELTRAFFANEITEEAGGTFKANGKDLAEVYPNANNEDLNAFCKQLKDLKQYFTRRGITIVPNGIKAVGTIETVDGTGTVHTVNVVGTLDLIGYDRQGNFHIFDMKTHRGFIDGKKKEKWRKQLTLYKQFLEKKYGINVVETAVIPIEVQYDAPFGSKYGTAKYAVSKEEKPEGYKGTTNNQLLVDGEEFRGAKPSLPTQGRRLLPLKEIDINIDYVKLADDPTNGLGHGTETVRQAISSSKELLGDIKRLFNEHALPEFAKFLKSFIGDTVEIADPDRKGKFKTITVEELLKKADVDITWAQKMLATMADTPNTLIQAFDKIYKDKKHEKDLAVIDFSQRATVLGIKYEKLGIKDYTFMFEDDKQEYINKFYDRSAYNRDYNKFLKELDAKYGTTEIGSEEYKAKNKERLKWIEDHTKLDTINGKKGRFPDRSIYPSKFNSLSQTQKDFYDEWMDMKAELDILLGENKTHLTNSIKIKKSNIERFRDSSKGGLINEFVNKIKAATLKSYDDETVYAKGIRDVRGNERMTVPLLYLSTNGEGAEDVSTDVIGTLIAYADMALNYKAMNDIVDAFEVGKAVLGGTENISGSLNIGKKRRGKKVAEKYIIGNTEVEGDVLINPENSNILEAINNFMESKIYERHQHEIGEFLGVDGNKIVEILTRLGSTVQLGFNLFANVANLVSGVGMANIEAAAKDYFTAKELWNADKWYFSHIGEMVGDIGSRTKHSKLALLSDLFNIKLEFSKDVRHKDFINRNFLTRFFGPAIQFIGQTAGDHWLYHRTAIARLDKEFGLTLNGEKISVGDAFDVVPIDEKVPEAGNKLVLKRGVLKKDGTVFTQEDIKRGIGLIWEMNKHLYGVYNTEDSIEARRYALGKLGMQYRDWMPPLYRHRFGKASSSLEGERRTEGFYRTTGRFLWNIMRDLSNGQKNMSQSWKDLDDNERKNVMRAVWETSQVALVMIIAKLLKGDPKERPWAMKALSYLATRAVTELGALNPLGAYSEGRKLLSSPFAATSVLDNIQGLFSLLWPPNYCDEIKSGDYKGHSSAYKAFLKSPFSVWYSTIKRTASPERAEQYYDS
jgi:hypothetical protein